MINKIRILTFFNFLILFFSLNAQALFEVKDASDNTVLEVSQDGLRIFNMGDTLMVISSSEIKAFIDENAKDRALSRSFSITTSTSAEKGVGDVVNIAADGLRVYSANENLMDITKGNITAYIDTSFSFNVTSTSAGKLDTDVLEVTTESTKMREGDLGNEYTDFSPDNIFLGLNAGQIATGVNNVFVGNQAGLTNGTGHSNVFVGPEAGYSNTGGDENVFMGYRSGQSNLSGGRNIFIGNEAGLSNTSGAANVCIGDTAGKDNTESFNVFIGSAAGEESSSGKYNTFVGSHAGEYNAIYNSNTYMGFLAGSACNGSENTSIGMSSGWKHGSNNVSIGYNAGSGGGDGSGNIFIGHGAVVSGSNKLAIDNSNTSTPLIYGDFDTNALTINGSVDIPSLYATTSTNSRKYVFVDINGKLCVAAKDDMNLLDNKEIELLKKENEKLKIENDEIKNRLNEIEEFLKK